MCVTADSKNNFGNYFLFYWRWEERSWQTSREKDQFSHHCWQAPRYLHWVVSPGIPAHCPGNHLSSGLLHLPFLSHGEGVLGFSSASFLDGLMGLPSFSFGPAMHLCPLCCSWPEAVKGPVFGTRLGCCMPWQVEVQPVPRLTSVPRSSAPSPVDQPWSLAQKVSCVCLTAVLQDVESMSFIMEDLTITVLKESL